MSYLNDVYYADPNEGKLYSLSNDNSSIMGATGKRPSAICVDLDKTTVWVVNTASNSVSKFVNGAKAIDIQVGSTPMGICQGGAAGVVYVTNYGSRTVSKIEGVAVTKTIFVGSGPKGICCTKDKAVWVANSVSSTVSKIVNDVKVLDIDVKYAPTGICANQYNEVFTANAVSGTVSKIYEDTKVLDITVGKVPMGICIDKNNNIWVANYNGGTVSKIAKGTSTVAVTTDVGESPFAIGSSSDGYIYVFNYGENTISKLDANTGALIKTITASCYNPSGFGDFTGSQTYYTFVTGGGEGSSKISYDDLDTDLQQRISNMVSGNIADSLVTHNDPNYTTVKAALDYLLSKVETAFAFSTAFTNNVLNAVTGSTVSSITFTWKFNKTPDSITIKDSNGTSLGTIDKTAQSFIYTGNVTATTEFTITAVLGTETLTGTTAVTFAAAATTHKVYIGSSTKTAITADDLSTASFASYDVENYDLTATVACADETNGAYVYFVFPADSGLVSATSFKDKSNNLTMADWTEATIDVSGTSYIARRVTNIMYQTVAIICANGTTAIAYPKA